MTEASTDLETELSLDAKRCEDLSKLFASLLTGKTQDKTVPFTAPVLLLGDGQKELSLDFSKPNQGRVTLHEYQFIQRHRDLALDQPMSVSFSVKVETKPGKPFGFDTRIFDAHAQNLSETKTTLRSLEKSDISNMVGTKMPSNVKSDDLAWQSSQPFTHDRIAQYQTLASDNNPLHFDAHYAQGFGLAGTIVPGMLIAGLLEGVMDARAPDLYLASARIRFLAPVNTNCRVNFGVLKKPGLAGAKVTKFRIFVLTDNSTVAAIADIVMQ